MSIYRTTNPTEFDDVDGIIINETAPAPNIAGVESNVAILVGQFERGLASLAEVGSIGELHETYGADSDFEGNKALKNKKFGRLRIARVIAADGVVASKGFQSSATDRITFYAKQGKGAYGNGITVTIASGTNVGKKYTIADTNSSAVLPTEVYDDIEIDAITSETFAASKLVTATVNSTAAEPSNASATALDSGSDGTVGNSDYQTAIAECEVEGAGNFLFLDVYNDVRNGYLETHVANTADKIVILAGAEGDSVSSAITDVADYRDTEGRLIYAYPWVQTVIGGANVYQSPASWYASILSQTAPHIDPAYVANSQYLGGITGLKLNLSRANYIALKDAGISAFEYDSDIGFKVKSGVTTQISNSSKVMVMRRRMADYLALSIAKYLKNYQNAPNTKQNRSEVKAAIIRWDNDQENSGILPKDSEVTSGKAKLIDTESLNTDGSIAAGFFKILYKRRIFSSMRYIVLQAEIGESVVVTEGEA
jgi:hypothetical protein